MKHVSLSLLLMLALFGQALAQTPALRDYYRGNQHRWIKELADFLTLPNVASDRVNIRRNTSHLLELMRQRGLTPRLLEAPDPVHQSEHKQVVFGVRGDTNVDVTTYGPKRPLHSGHYGNWASNPALRLAKLLASMKDANGRVTIKDWSDDVEPFGPAERRALREVPDFDQAIRNELGLARSEGGGLSLNESERVGRPGPGPETSAPGPVFYSSGVWRRARRACWWHGTARQAACAPGGHPSSYCRG